MPLLTASTLPNALSKDDYAKTFRYREAIQTQDESHSLKSRLARMLLQIQYEKEVDKKRKSGIKEGQVKSQAITSLLSRIRPTEGDGVSRARAKFHAHKRLAERWWWLVRFFGLGGVLACSEETAKKMLVLRYLTHVAC